MHWSVFFSSIMFLRMIFVWLMFSCHVWFLGMVFMWLSVIFLSVIFV